MFEDDMLRLANEISKEEIRLDTDLQESRSFSSFQTMVFVSRVEKIAGKELSYKDVQKLRTIRRIGEFLDG